jgi:hypothetical protein
MQLIAVLIVAALIDRSNGSRPVIHERSTATKISPRLDDSAIDHEMILPLIKLLYLEYRRSFCANFRARQHYSAMSL